MLCGDRHRRLQIRGLLLVSEDRGQHAPLFRLCLPTLTRPAAAPAAQSPRSPPPIGAAAASTAATELPSEASQSHTVRGRLGPSVDMLRERPRAVVREAVAAVKETAEAVQTLNRRDSAAPPESDAARGRRLRNEARNRRRRERAERWRKAAAQARVNGGGSGEQDAEQSGSDCSAADAEADFISEDEHSVTSVGHEKGLRHGSGSRLASAHSAQARESSTEAHGSSRQEQAVDLVHESAPTSLRSTHTPATHRGVDCALPDAGRLNADRSSSGAAKGDGPHDALQTSGSSTGAPDAQGVHVNDDSTLANGLARSSSATGAPHPRRGSQGGDHRHTAHDRHAVPALQPDGQQVSPTAAGKGQDAGSPTAKHATGSSGGSEASTDDFEGPDGSPLVPLLAAKQSLFLWSWHGWVAALVAIGVAPCNLYALTLHSIRCRCLRCTVAAFMLLAPRLALAML